MARKGARVFVLDLHPPDKTTVPLPPSGEQPLPASATFVRCDTTSWTDLKAAFGLALAQGGTGRIDIAIANAGVSEEYDYFADTYDDKGELLEPSFGVLDVNFRGVVNFVKLAVSQMRRQRREAIGGSNAGGSIVITSSATAYAPEHNLPVYSASKSAV
jgi:NAD(P)-dependent dehydrogenase (short-subunit alcohol dehydrogenase family)